MGRFINKNKNLCFGTIFFVFSAIFFAPQSNAQSFAGTPGGTADLTVAPSGDAFSNFLSDGEITGCATDTWTAMVNQSVAQTRRETAFNKRFITKSDSVLQYSCFDQTIIGAVENVGPIFSSSDFWEDKAVDILDEEDIYINIYDNDPEYEFNYINDYLSKNTLEESLILVVDSAFQNYINGQFNHPFISGTTPVSGTGLEPCTSMAEVWQAAKCENFGGTIPFPTFEEMAAGYEPRQFPPGAGWQCN